VIRGPKPSRERERENIMLGERLKRVVKLVEQKKEVTD